MAKRVAHRPILIIVGAGILLMVLLLITGIISQRALFRQAEKRSNEMGERIALTSFTIFKSKLESYKQAIMFLDFLHSQSSGSKVDAHSAFTSLSKLDSSVVLCWSRTNGVTDSRISPLEQENYLQGVPEALREGIELYGGVSALNHHPLLHVVKTSVRGKDKVQVGIVIDLIVFHEKLHKVRELQSAYVVITDFNRRTLYHPDEKIIGQKDAELSFLPSIDGVIDTGCIRSAAHSRYLGIPVYLHSFPYSFGSSKLLISVNVPNLEFVDFQKKLSRTLWLLIILPIVLLIAFAFIGFVVLRNELIRRKEAEKDVLKLQLLTEQQSREMVTSELENLRSGVNPHFLFNSLSSLVALIKRSPEKAVTFTRALSSQYRYLLDVENRNVTSLDEEMEFTNHYITIQSYRFGDGIRFMSNIPQGIKKGVPPLAVQTLVENCIKHNASSASNPLVIEVFLLGDNVVVSNNLNRRTTVVESTGKGLANLVRRYSYFTGKECVFEEKDGHFHACIPLLDME